MATEKPSRKSSKVGKALTIDELDEIKADEAADKIFNAGEAKRSHRTTAHGGGMGPIEVRKARAAEVQLETNSNNAARAGHQTSESVAESPLVLPHTSPVKIIRSFAEALEKELAPKVNELEELLRPLAGHDFGRDVQEKREFARTLNWVLARLGARLIASDGGQGRIVVTSPPRSAGAFQIQQTGTPSRKTDTSTLLPRLRLAHSDDFK